MNLATLPPLTAFDFVRLLKQARRALHLTQAQLAARIGIHPETLSRWENRKVDPGISALFAWIEEVEKAITLKDRD